MSEESEFILLGKINGMHGVQGWVKVFSHTSPRIQITQYDHWYLQRQGEWVRFNILTGKEQGKNILVHLEGINDRNQAEALIGSPLAIMENQLMSLPPGQYYWKDLQGMAVETLKGEKLGTVDWLFDTGSNDVMIINGDSVGERERMIPFVLGDVVKQVDTETARLIVDWDYDF